MSLRDTLSNLIRRQPPPSPDADPRQSPSRIEGGRRAGESDNPYTTARRTWNDHVGGVMAERRTWQIVGLLSLTIALAAVGGLIYIGSQSKFIPYVIEVDKLGNVATSGAASVGSHHVSDRAKNAALADWITCVRLVTPDVSMQRKCIFKAFSMTNPNDPATQKLNEWYNSPTANAPFERAQKEMVSTDIRTVMPQTKDTWQIEWIETTRDNNGTMQKSPVTMRALVTVYIAEYTPQTTEDQLRLNPLSIYIRDFSWSVIQ